MSQSEAAPDYHSWIEQLYEPHTRRAARQKLVREKAVGPLLECLDSPNDAVVWAAVESLGELRVPEAVAPLLDLLARGQLVVDVSDALTRITGQDFGADVRRWRDWIASTGGKIAPAVDVAACIRSTGQFLGAEPAGSDKTYQFKLSLPSGREQKVAVFFGREDDQGDEIVVIYSECGPADPKYYESVLRKNLTIPAGALAIRDIDDKPNFVMVDTLLAASITPRSLAKSIENIASRADSIEKSLTREDRR